MEHGSIVGHEEEDDPITFEEGKKRPRSDPKSVSFVSGNRDSRETSNLQNASQGQEGDKLDLQVKSFLQNFIDLVVKEEGMKEWRLTSFYGFPERGHRWESWELLRGLNEGNVLPWICLGDLNELLSEDEKMGGEAHPRYLMNDFLQALLDCNLSDITVEGYQFLREKGRGTDHWVRERLNREWQRANALCKASHIINAGAGLVTQNNSRSGEVVVGSQWFCHVDAAIFDRMGQVGFGSIFRESNGTFVKAISGFIPG
ncbi:hypothetical protein K2173_009009 [Erythroxylum novogranatense]|uniref:Uncharacterized protein n=1 Tax=Erythroxylum novogranatense TaxID=1862640 RepID=A0AAV8TSE9_9ROSI|nr:hypothetical protein K2173_009009 [Erythroxylum novogranatense]